MRVRVLNSWFAGVTLYLLTILGIALLTVKLSSVLATQAIALTEPYLLSNCPCLPSLIEQRRMAAQDATPMMADRTRTQVTSLEAPSVSADVLAAQMDLAEKEDSRRD